MAALVESSNSYYDEDNINSIGEVVTVITIPDVLIERSACPSPFYDEDSAEVVYQQPAVLIRPTPIRPLQLTVEEVEAFYNAAYEMELPAQEVHTALQDWQNKFAQYVELPNVDSSNCCDAHEDNDEEEDEEQFNEISTTSRNHHKRVRFEDQHQGIIDTCKTPTAPISDVQLFKPVPVRTTIDISKHFFDSNQSTTTKSDDLSPASSITASSDSSVELRYHQTENNYLSTSIQQPVLIEPEEEETTTVVPPTLVRPVVSKPLIPTLQTARDGLLQALSAAKGDTTTTAFQANLDILKYYYRSSDIRHTMNMMHGTWLTLTKPVYADCLGENDSGDPMYTLSRLSFDMFSPDDLVCSLQGNFNVVDDDGTYRILTAFTIESCMPNDVNKNVTIPIRGILSTTGCILPDPDVSNRHSVWIHSGCIEANETKRDQQAWKKFFTNHNNTKKSFKCQAMQLASRWFLGASLDETQPTSQSYSFAKPLGGHGRSWIDTLYCDNSLRIVQGHKGTIFVFSKLHKN